MGFGVDEADIFEDEDSCPLSDGMRRCLEDEVRVDFLAGCQACYELMNRSSLDLLEVCAPWDANLTAAVREEGGKALSIGVHNGFDLSTNVGMKRAAALIREKRPRYLHVSPPCELWSSLRNLISTRRLGVERAEQLRNKLQEDRAFGRRLLKNCRKLVEIQTQELNAGAGGSWDDPRTWEHHAGGEHPLRAQSWGLPEWKDMVRMCGGQRFRVDGCMHGIRCPKTGVVPQKMWGWFSSLPSIRHALEKTCQHGAYAHESLRGSRAAPTASYPYLLCRRFAKALMNEVLRYSEDKSCPGPQRLSEEAFHATDAILAEVDEEDESGALSEDRREAEAEASPQEPEAQEPPVNAEIRRKLIMVHRNLGHPSKEVMLKMLKDAGATPETLREAERFDCAECLQRGRRAPLKPSTVQHHTTKWRCMSIDTFWWHTPKEALGEGQRSQHMLCLSMMDEATDYHVVHVVKTSNEGPLTNITGPEFRAAFSESWLKILPSPQILRFDEEGFLKRLDVIEWLEGLGIQLEPVAGESPWQIGKHSRHLQTVKENLCLLCTELHNSVPCRELLSLVMSAKNCMHNIRGYSPNQWAFGQEHTRVSSFLQTGQHLPGHSARADESFEESLQRQMQARKMFLEVDARRRIQRALRAGSRPLKEFQMGELVYYYRRGRKQGSRYGGHWYGPARVLCHEKYGADGSGGTSGAIVWVSHAGKILRCSPEQLKHVTQDLRRLDQEINGPRSFHDMLLQVSQQQRYLDISAEGPGQSVADMSVDETAPKFRIRSKRSLPNTEAPESDPSQSLEGIDLDPEAVDLPTSSHGEVRRFQDYQGAPGHHPGAVPPLPGQTSTRRGEHLGGDSDVVDGSSQQPHRGGGQIQAPAVQPTRTRHSVREVGGQPHGQGQAHGHGHAESGSLPTSQADAGEGLESIQPFKRRVSAGGEVREEEARHERGKPRRPSGTGLRQQPEPRHGAGSLEPDRRDGSGSRPAHEPHGSDGDRLGRNSSRTPEASRFTSPEQPIRSRSRTPPPSGRTGGEVSGVHWVFSNDFDERFAGYIGTLNVIEMEIPIAPRDVHKSRGTWVVNQKARKSIEVNLKKLSQEDKEEFQKAMKVETNSFLSTEAIRICEKAGIPKERIMRMRFVLTWKSVLDHQGSQVGRKAKARLIVRGFEDPDLLDVERESPTLSAMGRNLLLATCAQEKLRVAVGDIKTAFLRGDNTEVQREVYAEPPEEAKALLGMSETQVFRILKAVYGLLHAPKKWFESLSRFLVHDGWVPHCLDQCLFKLVSPEGEIVGYLGVHVDDVLTGGTGSYYEGKIASLREHYPFGSWSYADKETVAYCGCELSQDTGGRIMLRQERFSLAVDEISLTKERQACSEEEITPSEKGDLRRVLGALSWRATQSAPWMLATVSHLQGCVEQGRVADLVAANKLVRLQRRLSEKGLVYQTDLVDPVIVTFTDASWATRRDGSSQGGQITLMMERKAVTGGHGRFSVLSWTSRRLKRVARSSTSAEAQMFGNGVDTHEFLKLAVHDMCHTTKLDLRDPDKYLQELESYVVSDSKNVYDAIAKVETSGLHMEEKRTAIELLGVKERLQQAKIVIKWVDGDQELADCLTKPWLHEQLMKALEIGAWTLTFDETIMSAKKKRQLKKQSGC